MPLRIAVTAIAGLLLAFGAAGSCAATRPLTLGIDDPTFLAGASAAPWFTRVAQSAGRIVRLEPAVVRPRADTPGQREFTR